MADRGNAEADARRAQVEKLLAKQRARMQTRDAIAGPSAVERALGSVTAPMRRVNKAAERRQKGY